MRSFKSQKWSCLQAHRSTVKAWGERSQLGQCSTEQDPVSTCRKALQIYLSTKPWVPPPALQEWECVFLWSNSLISRIELCSQCILTSLLDNKIIHKMTMRGDCHWLCFYSISPYWGVRSKLCQPSSTVLWPLQPGRAGASCRPTHSESQPGT